MGHVDRLDVIDRLETLIVDELLFDNVALLVSRLALLRLSTLSPMELAFYLTRFSNYLPETLVTLRIGRGSVRV